MSKYRYFELTGESLDLFLEVEGREMVHRDTVVKKMEENGIEEWEFVKYKEESEAQSKEDAPCYRL